MVMLTFAAMTTFLKNLWRLFKKPEYRAGIVWLTFLLLVGAVFYHQVEGWGWLDSLYFCIITLSTVGYGDLSPTMTSSKIFTMVYIFFGMSIFVSFASMLVQEQSERRKKRSEDKQKITSDPKDE